MTETVWETEWVDLPSAIAGMNVIAPLIILHNSDHSALKVSHGTINTHQPHAQVKGQ